MKYSLTQGGILVAVVGTLLVKAGFSDSCSSELVTNIPLLIGGVTAWIGRYRVGDVNLAGFKKF